MSFIIIKINAKTIPLTDGNIAQQIIIECYNLEYNSLFLGKQLANKGYEYQKISTRVLEKVLEFIEQKKLKLRILGLGNIYII